jgi:hypothetical protein
LETQAFNKLAPEPELRVVEQVLDAVAAVLITTINPAKTQAIGVYESLGVLIMFLLEFELGFGRRGESRAK